MSEVKVNKISPRSGTDVTLGDASDTFTLPASATLDVNGTLDLAGSTMTGFTIPSGQTLTVASGATIANSGTATGFGEDNTPSFYAYNASSQSLAGTTSTTVTLDTEGWDTDSAFASNVFTVPSGEGGKYWFTYGGYFNDVPSDERGMLNLMKNDAAIDQSYGIHWGPPSTEYIAFSCSCAVELAATDTLHAQMYTSYSSGLTVYYCFLSGIKLAGV